MGNTLVTANDNKMFNNSSVAQTVKNIVMDRQEVQLGKNVRVNIAKACAANVIKPGITKEPDFTSIPIPSIDPEADKKAQQMREKCTKDQENSRLSAAQQKEAIQKCLAAVRVYPMTTDYLGLQIDDQRDPYCGNHEGNSVGIAGINMSLNRGSEGKARSKADMFMLNYCAKSLYDRGCILMANKKVRIGQKEVTLQVPRLATSMENPKCYNYKGELNYGPPECSCINSIVGPSMNNWPTDSPHVDPTFPGNKNPYGLSDEYTSDSQAGGNNWTKYSLNIFRQPSHLQLPKGNDAKCTNNLISSKESGRAAAYLIKEFEANVTICMNQINIVDSNIGNLEISDVKQSCGNSSQDVNVSGASVSKSNKVDPIAQYQEELRIQREAEAKAKAEAEAAAERKRREDENRKVQEQMAAMQKMMADMAKAKADAEAKVAAEKAAAEKAAADKAKRDADEAAARAKNAAEKAEAEKRAADAKAKADKAEAEKRAADAKAAEEKAKADKAAADKAAADKVAADKARRDAEQAAANAKSVAERKEAEARAAQAKADAEKAEANKKAADATAADAAKKAQADKAAAAQAKDNANQAANQAQIANEKAKVEKTAEQALKTAEKTAKEALKTAEKTAKEAQNIANQASNEAKKVAEQASNNMTTIVGVIVVIAIIAVVIYFLTKSKAPDATVQMGQPMVVAPQMGQPMVMAPQVVAPQVVAPQVAQPMYR